jgi:hypothetical protein
MNFSRMFRDLPSMRLSHCNSCAEKSVLDGSDNAHNWTQAENLQVTDWLNGLAADFYDKRIVKFVQSLANV